MQTEKRIPKQYLTSTQVKEMLNITFPKLYKLDKQLRPSIISERGDRRYDSDVVIDYMEKARVK